MLLSKMAPSESSIAVLAGNSRLEASSVDATDIAKEVSVMEVEDSGTFCNAGATGAHEPTASETEVHPPMKDLNDHTEVHSGERRRSNRVAISRDFTPFPSRKPVEKKVSRKSADSASYNHNHCTLCEGTGNDMVCCDGPCQGSFHRHCLQFFVGLDLEMVDSSDSWLCANCSSQSHECVVCGISDSDSNLNHCSWPCCGSLYHLECSEKIKLAYKLDIKHLKKSDLCPRHFCFTCGNPARLKFKGKTEDLGKLIACFRCYRAFHECCAPKSSTFLEHTMLCAWHKTPKSTSRLELVSRLLPRHQFTEILGVEFAHVSDQQEFFFPTRWIPENYRTVHDYQYVASDEEEMEAAEFLKENSPKKIVPKDGVPKLNRASRPPKYGKLSANLYAKGTKPPVNKKFDDSSICNCSSGMQCAMDFCINRACHIECDQFCPCGPYCRNQRLQKKEYAKLKLIKTPNRGFGVITEQDLTPGDLVLEYCGEVITVEECQDRLIEMEKIGDKNYYFLALNASLILDAGRKGNIARFINHSCDPNCMTQKWTVGGVTRIGIYAKKNIRSGTELNYNYNFMGYGVDDEGQICYCGSANCPGYFSRRPLKEAKSKNPLKRKSKSKRKFSRQKSISAIQEKENLGMISTIKDHKNTNAEVESPRSKKRAVQEVSTETPTTEAENSEATDILMEDVEVQQLPNETLLKPLMLESQTDP